jgi:hypothetical protein
MPFIDPYKELQAVRLWQEMLNIQPKPISQDELDVINRSFEYWDRQKKYKKFHDFFSQDNGDEWSGMKHLNAPIHSYVGFTAGMLRSSAHGSCSIPEEIPDEALLQGGEVGGYNFSWWENHKLVQSEEIVL